MTATPTLDSLTHVRDSAEAERGAVEARDKAIREAFAFGLRAEVIAEAAGLSRQRVYQIVRAGQ